MLKKRKAIKIVLHIILAILVVVGLAIGSWYFIIWGVGTSISSCMDFFSETEPEEKTSGDFVYHIMSRGVEYDHEVIAIVGLAYLFGINGVWMAIPVAEFVCLFVSVYMFHKNKIHI